MPTRRWWGARRRRRGGGGAGGPGGRGGGGARRVRGVVGAGGVAGVQVAAGLLQVVVEESAGGVAGLAEVLAGGEVVSRRSVAAVRRACPQVAVRHLYGPTEVTLCATWHVVGAGEEVPAVLPIRRPLANRRRSEEHTSELHSHLNLVCRLLL